MNAKKILVGAKKLLENGWCQKHLNVIDENGNMSYCSIGAIHSAANNIALLRSQDRQRAYDSLRISIENYYIDNWNDHPDRTKEEVLAAFDKAIELAKQTDGE